MSNTKGKRFKRGDKPKVDHYKEITDRMIHAIENGVAPWQRPWDSAPLMFPRNAIKGTGYQSINFLLLASAPFEDPRWITFNAAKKEGWNVKKGESGYGVVFHVLRKMEDPDTLDPVTNEPVVKEVPVMKRFTVFNAEQVEGIPEFDASTQRVWADIAVLEQIVMASGIDLRHGGDSIHYDVDGDFVRIPLRSQFASDVDYYSTLMYGIAHWTGHSSRLKREMGEFGDEDYAREELRAAIASAMLCAEYGLPHDPAPHAAYAEAWVALLQNDKKEIFKAARDARTICDYVAQFAPIPEFIMSQEADIDGEALTSDIDEAMAGEFVLERMERAPVVQKEIDGDPETKDGDDDPLSIADRPKHRF